MLKLRKPGSHCWPKQWQRLPSLQGQPWTALPSPWLMPWLHMCKRTFWTTIASTLGIKQTWHTWGQPFRLIPFPWFSFSFTFRWRLCLHLWRWCCLWQLWTLLFTNFSGIGILRFGWRKCMLDRFFVLIFTHLPQGCLEFSKEPIKSSTVRIWWSIFDSINVTLNQPAPLYPTEKSWCAVSAVCWNPAARGRGSSF